MFARSVVAALLAGACTAGGVLLAAPATRLVVCAPGYPGTTEDAQPTMDELARSVSRAAGWPDGRVTAEYFPSHADGLEALQDESAALALVPLPFFLEHREPLGLRPILRVAQADAADEVWSLVARAGAVATPATLAGWEVRGMPGYSPRFVRHVALRDWGELPPDVRIEFDGRVLGVLRRAARGDRVAAMLDRAQTEALGSLPFADDLAVVARSRPMIGSLLCSVGGRLGDESVQRLTSAFLGLERSEGGRELLDTLRVARFEPLDEGELSGPQRAFAAEGAPGR
jgi:hypothetical protein